MNLSCIICSLLTGAMILLSQGCSENSPQVRKYYISSTTIHCKTMSYRNSSINLQDCVHGAGNAKYPDIYGASNVIIVE